MTTSTVLSATERASALAELPDWRYWLQSLHTAYECMTAGAATALIAAIGSAAEELDHHPDLDWRYRHVFVRLSTHAAGHRVSTRDVELARAISQAARSTGATAQPTLCRTVEIAVDATDPAAISGAWADALGYDADAEGNLFDPWRRGPAVWFQQTATPDPSRIHLDVQVEDDTADAVIAEAVEAGAVRLDERFRPSFTVLADADGNRICVCTNLGRD